MTIRMGSEKIQTHSYLLTFNKSIISKEINIGIYYEKVKQYDPHFIKVL